MNTVPLTEYLKTHTQAEAARIMGMTQGGIHLILKRNREFYMMMTPDGVVRDWYEVKRPASKIQVPAA